MTAALDDDPPAGICLVCSTDAEFDAAGDDTVMSICDRCRERAGRLDGDQLTGADELVDRLSEGYAPPCPACGAVDSPALQLTDRELIGRLTELVNVIRARPAAALDLVAGITANRADARRALHLFADELAVRCLTPMPPAEP